MDDLIYLIARHTVRIAVEDRSWGTTQGDINLSATAVIENDGRKLMANSHAYGRVEKMIELRKEVVCSVLARLRRQVEALEALK